jgi:hypothetical protein
MHGARAVVALPGEEAAGFEALKTAGEKFDANLQLDEAEVDEMIEDFDGLRRGSHD